MIIIGEKLNSSIPKTREMIQKRDQVVLKGLVKQQVNAGADFIDINAGTFISNEIELMKWMVEIVQEITDIPICIDSTNPRAIEESLKLCKSKALINSISLDGARFNDISELAHKYGSAVIGLCQETDKIPDNAVERIAAGSHLVEKLLEAGIPQDDIYLDPLVNAIATNQKAALTVFDTITGLKQSVPGIKIVCGLSNVGFGLPQRSLINKAFVAILISAGLDGAIIDPLNRGLMDMIAAAEMLVGRDPRCRKFLNMFRAKVTI